MELILELAFLLNLLLSGLFSKAKYFDVCDNFQDKCFDVSKLTAWQFFQAGESLMFGCNLQEFFFKLATQRSFQAGGCFDVWEHFQDKCRLASVVD